MDSLRILQWNSGRGLSSSRRAELCSFLSSNRYDLVLLQETNLSSSRNFKVPGYSVLLADRTLTHRGPFIDGNQNGWGVLTLINQRWSPPDPVVDRSCNSCVQGSVWPSRVILCPCHSTVFATNDWTTFILLGGVHKRRLQSGKREVLQMRASALFMQKFSECFEIYGVFARTRELRQCGQERRSIFLAMLCGRLMGGPY